MTKKRRVRAFRNSKHSSDMEEDKPQIKASFTILTNLNKIDESKSEVSQNNKSQSSNSDRDDSSNKEAMIKQEIN